MADLYIFLILLALGFTIGTTVEKRHFRSLIRREAEHADLLLIASKLPTPDLKISESHLVGGNAVISVDYFKRFVAGLRNLVGGRMNAYESLVDRARREALLRLKDEAKQLGADMVFNIKIETASISQSANKALGSIEVYAYGTAVKTARQ
ncbi:MAG: YbjQ family protein [Gammaproteobacteria bacterium]|nr:MAG: YbjQ family protein [Gammaproteobacteria bacterium]RTZ61676.1 MAG: YbjQ family protein [Gammaproteobacteria bacterium]